MCVTSYDTLDVAVSNKNTFGGNVGLAGATLLALPYRTGGLVFNVRFFFDAENSC